MSLSREVRRELWDAFDTVLRQFGGYAKSRVTSAGYVGTVEKELREVEEVLSEMGFSFSLVAAIKDRECPKGSRVEAGSWVHRDGILDEHQLHVHLFSSETGTDVYSHYERNSIVSPVKHYARVGCDEEKGVEMLERMFEQEGVEYVKKPREERCGI